MDGNGERKASPAARVKGFHHVALRARDFDASMRFYEQGLGMTPRISWGEGDGRAVMLDAGSGNCLELFAGGKAGEREGVILHLALRTTDCDQALDRAKRSGAVVTMEPQTHVIPGKPKPATVRIAFCKGPDGEIIELFQSGDL